jgi:hypothetical protein
MDGEPEKISRDDLHGVEDDLVPDVGGVELGGVRDVGRLPQESGCGQQFDHLGGVLRGALPVDEFIAGQLLEEKTIVRLVVVERANDIVVTFPDTVVRLDDRGVVVGPKRSTRQTASSQCCPNVRRSAERKGRSTSRSQASKRRQQKASTSSGVGVTPMSSKLARRMSVRRSASGENVSPFASSFSSRNASTGVRTSSGLSTTGTAGRGGVRNAQSLRASSVSGGESSAVSGPPS